MTNNKESLTSRPKQILKNKTFKKKKKKKKLPWAYQNYFENVIIKYNFY